MRLDANSSMARRGFTERMLRRGPLEAIATAIIAALRFRSSRRHVRFRPVPLSSQYLQNDAQIKKSLESSVTP